MTHDRDDFSRSLLDCVVQKESDKMHPFILDTLGAVSNELRYVDNSEDYTDSQKDEYLEDLKDSLLLLIFQYRTTFLTMVKEEITLDYLSAILSGLLDILLSQKGSIDLSGFIAMCRFNLKDSKRHILDVLVQSEKLSEENSMKLQVLFKDVMNHFENVQKVDLLALVKIVYIYRKLDSKTKFCFEKLLRTVSTISGLSKLSSNCQFSKVYQEHISYTKFVQNILNPEICSDEMLDMMLDYLNPSNESSSSSDECPSLPEEDKQDKVDKPPPADRSFGLDATYDDSQDPFISFQKKPNQSKKVENLIHIDEFVQANEPTVVDIPADQVDIPADQVDIPADQVDIPADQVDIPADKVDIPADKVDIPADKVDIPADKVDIPADEIITIEDEPVEGHLLLNMDSDNGEVIVEEDEDIMTMDLEEQKQVSPQLSAQCKTYSRQVDKRMDMVDDQPNITGNVASPKKYRGIKEMEVVLGEPQSILVGTGVTEMSVAPSGKTYFSINPYVISNESIQERLCSGMCTPLRRSRRISASTCYTPDMNSPKPIKFDKIVENDVVNVSDTVKKKTRKVKEKTGKAPDTPGYLTRLRQKTNSESQ